MSVFAELDVYRDIDSRGGAMNMAIDEALLETVARPTIRFYKWNHPALSFGYFGKFDDVANHKRDIVRRWTGGGIVFHGEDLTYSIVIPATDAAFGQPSMSIYEAIHNALGVSFAESGQHVELVANAETKVSESCFANPVRSDVISNGRKIAGAAQRRTRRGLLQQGSIQNIDFGNGLADRFATELCHDCNREKLHHALLARAEEIAQRKYRTDAWLRKR